MPVIRRCRLALAPVCFVVLAGCAGPPTKELSQAEGAIEAARAAGAADFAAVELAAAEQTLARANAAVAERDFRAALGHALDSSARAQGAAASAVEGRVKARLAADQTLDDFSTLIDRVDAALATPEAKRVPPATRRKGAAAVASALEVLANARAAVERNDLSMLTAIPPHTAALDAALAALAPPPARKARPRP